MDYIISQLINFVAEAIASLFNGLISAFEGGIGLNGDKTLAGFFMLFPFCRGAYTVFMYAGFFILFTICVFQLFKALFGPIADAESPLGLVVKTIFFTIIVAFSKEICNYIIYVGSAPYQILNDVDLMNDLSMSPDDFSLVLNMDTFSDLIGDQFTGGLTASSFIIGSLFFIIFLILLIKEFFLLLIEIAERYVILGLLTTVAPLCFACGASKATNHVFKSYVKMYISQIIVMCFSIFFLRSFSLAVGRWLSVGLLAGSLVGTNFNGETITSDDLPGFFVQSLMLLAWLKLGQKVDSHMGQLGLNVAQAGGTGDAFFRAMSEGVKPGSIASGIHNAIANKALGTNFGRGNAGKENMYQALVNGNMGKKAGVLDAARADKTKSSTFGISKAKGEALAKNPDAAYNSKQLQSMMADKQNVYGGSAANGGFAIANGIKDAYGLPEDWKAGANSYIHGDKVHAEFTDPKTGEVHAFDGTTGDTMGKQELGRLQGNGEFSDLKITSASDSALAAINNEGKDGADFSADSQDFKKVENDGASMEEVKNSPDDNMQNNDVDPENAVRWDGDQIVPPPGDEPEREAFGEGEEGEKAYQEAHDEWQANKDAYDAASVTAPDGNMYSQDDVDNLVHWDGDNAIAPPGEEPDFMEKPNEDDQKYKDIAAEKTEEAMANGMSKEDAEKFGQEEAHKAFEEDMAAFNEKYPDEDSYNQAKQEHDEWQANKDAYDNASVMAPDGSIQKAEPQEQDDNAIRWDGNQMVNPPGEEPPQPGKEPDFMAAPDRNDDKYKAIEEKSGKDAADKAFANDTAAFNKKYEGGADGQAYKDAKQAHDQWQSDKTAHDQWQSNKDAYDKASTIAPDGKVHEKGSLDNATRWDGNKPVAAPGAEPPKGTKAHDQWQANKDAYDKASVVAPDGKVYKAGAQMQSDGTIKGEQASGKQFQGTAISPKNSQAYDENGNKVGLNNVARFDSNNNVVPPPKDRKAYGEGPAGDKAFKEAQKAYNNAKLTDKDGNMYKANEAGEPSGRLYATPPSLTNSKGESVAANQTVRYAKGADGKMQELHPPVAPPAGASPAEKANYAAQQKAYNNASMVAPDGNVYQSQNGKKGEVLASSNHSNNGHAFAKVEAGTNTITKSDSGNMAATVSQSGMMLQQTTGTGNGGIRGGRAVLESGGANGYVPNAKGDMAYNEKTNSFVSASSAIDSNGKIADGIAGRYTDSTGKTVNASEALSSDGKLKDGYKSEVSHFSQVGANSPLGQSLASQNQSGEGIALKQTGDGNIKRFDADGNASATGHFVKTESGQMLHEDAFKKGADGHVANHGLVESSNNGYQDLKTDSSGHIQTFDRSGNAVEGGKGEYVEDSKGNRMSTSSFAFNEQGQVQGFSSSTASSDSYDKLVTNTSGGLQTFDANMRPCDDGQFYMKQGSNGNELVDKNNYSTNESGMTRTYNPTGSYGDVVQTVNEAGEVTGYAQLSNPQQWSAPVTYDKVPDSSAQGYHYEQNSSGTGKYVATLDNDGNQQFSQVRATESSEPISTYTSKSVSAVVSELNGSPAEKSIVGYSSASNGSGEYFQDTQGNHHKISSYDGNNQMQRYDKVGDSYVPSENGAYARTEDPHQPGNYSYHELGSDKTYNANYATNNGISINQTSPEGESMVSIPKTSIKPVPGEPGHQTCNIGGREYSLLSTSIYREDQMDPATTKKVSFEGHEYYMRENNSSFNVQSNSKIKSTHYGQEANKIAESFGYVPKDPNSIAAIRTEQNSTALYDPNSPRKHIPAKDGQPECWVQSAKMYTDKKPEGRHKVVREKTTGRTMYEIETQVKYDSEHGGTAALVFPKQIQENNRAKSERKVGFKQGVTKSKKAKSKDPRDQMRGR